MAEVKIKGQLYEVASDGAFDYASNSGSICYYCSKGTKQWLPYQHPTQPWSSGSKTIPVQYSNRLAADVYDDNIGDVQIRWGPAAQTWLQNETLSKGVSIATVKALTEHFTYELAARIGSPRAIIRYVGYENLLHVTFLPLTMANNKSHYFSDHRRKASALIIWLIRKLMIASILVLN